MQKRTFTRTLIGFGESLSGFFPGKELSGGFARTVLLKLADSNKELIVRAELPGFKKDEISLKVTENAIFLAAEKKKQKLEQAKGFFRAEKSYGSASRMFTLPHPVKPAEAKAKFVDGVLEIILPKAGTKKEKQVKVE